MVAICFNEVCYLINYFTGAVHRFFGSRRRLFNDDQPVRVEAANATKKL